MMTMCCRVKIAYLTFHGRLTSLLCVVLSQGCAVSVGFVASAHLDSVLVKLDTVYKLDTSKKSSGLFGFIKVIIIISRL